VLDLFFMDSSNRKIAIVDDDAGVRQSLERLLHLVGYSVRSFASGPEFLAAIETDPAHCVVIDINLGVGSGLDIAEHPLVAGGKIPVIFISGAAEERVRSRAHAAGCIALLSKPFKPVALLDAIFRATQDPTPIS
jgi:FixJ family two-component response regulator